MSSKNEDKKIAAENSESSPEENVKYDGKDSSAENPDLFTDSHEGNNVNNPPPQNNDELKRRLKVNQNF